LSKQILRQFLAEHWGKVVGGLAGLLVGLVFVIFGFWRSLVIFTFVILGVYLGKTLDRNDSLRGLFQRFWSDSD
jgi:uncharacterized membrane protein